VIADGGERLPGVRISRVLRGHFEGRMNYNTLSRRTSSTIFLPPYKTHMFLFEHHRYYFISETHPVHAAANLLSLYAHLFITKLHQVLCMEAPQRIAMASAARQASLRFSEAEFSSAFLGALLPVLSA
jgi:hypothetical protein